MTAGVGVVGVVGVEIDLVYNNKLIIIIIIIIINRLILVEFLT